MENKKKVFIAAGVIILLAAVICGVLFYKKTHPKKAVFVPPQKMSSTFANTPYPDFPLELTPAMSSAPQYFDSAQTTGAIFLVKENLQQADADYGRQLAKTAWGVSGKTVSAQSVSFNLQNKQTNKSALIRMALLPNKFTSLVISFNK